MSIDEHRGADEQEPAAPPLAEPSAELLFGAGQSAWLAVVTVGVALALVMSVIALFVALDDDAPATVAAPSGPVTSVEIEASEFVFDPTEVTVAADTDVAVTLDNVGSVQHNWTVLEAGTTISAESDYDEALAVTTVDAEAGASATGSVNLPAGSYQVICTIAGHFSAGMEGSLEVAS